MTSDRSGIPGTARQRHLPLIASLGAASLFAFVSSQLALSLPEGPFQSPPSAQGEDARPKKPRPPLELALDGNGDGIIDADEIANASVALKKLDKNGDGKLTPDEYRPPRPPEGASPQQGRAGQEGLR